MTTRNNAEEPTVTKTPFWQASHEGCQVWGQIFGRSSGHGEDLYGLLSEYVLATDETMARLERSVVIHSPDNGKTWRELEAFATTDTPDGVRTESVICCILDTRRDLFLRFLSCQFVKDGKFFGGGATDRKRFIRGYYQVSRDGGRTWEEKQGLIQSGADFDESHWAKGIVYGRNGGRAVHTPIQLRNGNIILLFVIWPWNEEKQSIHGMQCGVFIGTWRRDLSGLDWGIGEYIKPITRLDPDEGGNLVEITVAELSDDLILGIMRGFSANWPVKYYSLSKDGGLSWSDPEPLLYDDGELMFSPASISRLIRCAGNGKLYWIGNIHERRDELLSYDSSRPRERLHIAEVDEAGIRIVRDSIRIIDQQRPGDVVRDYSNFGVYEDRVSGRLVLTMCERVALPIKHGDLYPAPYASRDNWTSDTYRYEIDLGEEDGS